MGDRDSSKPQRGGWQTRHSLITGVGVTAGAALGVAAPAFGVSQNYFVGTTGDPNVAPPGDCTSPANTDCSLRQAITLANANALQYDYIYFRSGLSGTISLTTLAGGQIPITDATYIYGPGPSRLSVQAAPSTRIFDVNPATAGDRVQIDGLTLTGGNVTGDGGAIANDDASLRLLNAVLTGNTASGRGGAINEAGNFQNGSYDSFSYVTFSDNHATYGGAINAAVNWGATREATFSGNSATGGSGGAINGAGGYLVDSTISGNTSATAGGGASATSAIGLYGTILANNTAPANPDLNASGGYVSYDLVENPGTTGIGVVSGVITGQDPQLGPLTLNGGFTALPTLKPGAGSPVVDQSYSFFYYDERGLPRIVDNPNRPNAAGGYYAGADIGAVELTLSEGPQATPVPPPTPTPAPTPPAQHKKKCKKKHRRSASTARKCKRKRRSLSSVSGFHFAAPSLRAAGADVGDDAFRLRQLRRAR